MEMESLKDEMSQTRFSTPVSELDDHRNQPTSLPRAESMTARRPTVVTYEGTIPFPDMHRIHEELAAHNPRDFEHAIEDADDDRLAVPTGRGHNRRTSSTSGVGPSRVMVRLQKAQSSRGSVNSTHSSRSTSPPNSVDAFADPRVVRARAGTITSKPESEPDHEKKHSVHGRRGTFTGASVGRSRVGDDEPTGGQDSEDDVCMPPPEEWTKTLPIDFEVLEEYIAEKKAAERLARMQANVDESYRTGRVQRSDSIHTVNNDTIKDILEIDSLDEKDAALPTSPMIKPFAQQTRRYTFFSSEQEAMVHASDIEDLVTPDVSFRDLFELPEQGGVWWLDCLNPTNDEIEALTKAFYVHPLTKEDIMTQESREKVELFQKYYFVSFRSFQQSDKDAEDYLEPVQVYIIVFRTGVLSFAFSAVPHAANVIRRIGRLRDYVALGSDWICYAMIDDIVDSFGPVIHEIEEETDAIEDNVFIARMEDFKMLLQQIGECRRKAMIVLRLLGGKADVIKGFAKRCNEQYSITPRGDIGLYLGDVQDHVVTMMSNLAHCEKMLSRSHANYLAQISIDQIQVGNKANEVLSKITLLASILVPLNLVTGLFGMNVAVPGKNSNNLNWFAGIVGGLAFFILIALVVARRFKAI